MIEPLPIAFKAKERIYRQLARKGFVALYEVRNLRHILIGFEVIVVRFQKAKIFPSGSSQPAKERYPFNSEFGRYAWSLPTGTLALAELFFDQLASNQPEINPIRDVLGDNSVRKYPTTGPAPSWYVAMSFLTGRPLPKHPRWFHEPIKIKDQLAIDPVEFEEIKPQPSHNEDSP